jgi:hypothetical protein
LPPLFIFKDKRGKIIENDLVNCYVPGCAQEMAWFDPEVGRKYVDQI